MIKSAEFFKLERFLLNPTYQAEEIVVRFPQKFENELKTRYNIPQIKAIYDINKRLNAISLLHCPPGTGKTHTIVGLISSFLLKNLESDKRVKILFCASNNTTVDKIALACLKQGLFDENGDRMNSLKMVRMGLHNAHQDIQIKHFNV